MVIINKTDKDGKVLVAIVTVLWGGARPRLPEGWNRSTAGYANLLAQPDHEEVIGDDLKELKATINDMNPMIQ